MFVSIFSPKGGVGKTTLSLALTEVLSQSRKTCIVEFDFSPGDFPSLLDINKDNNLLRAVKNGVRKTVQKPEKKNYYVITGGYPDTHERFTREEIDKLLMELDSNFEVSIFDIQPGLIENSVEVLKNSDKIVIITEDDKATVLRTARVLKWLESGSFVKLSKVDIIVNKAASKLTNIPENIVTFKVPYYGFQLTFDSKNLLKHMEYYKKFILNEPIPRGFLIKPPEIKKVDPHDIQVFISTAVNTLKTDDYDRKEDFILENDVFADDNLSSAPEDIFLNKSDEAYAKNINTSERRKNMVYVKTHYETLNSVISKEIENVTDDFDKADILVVSSFSEDEIDEYVGSNKKIILFTTPYYERYARNKGIKYVFTEEASISEIINAVEELLSESESVKTEDKFYTDREMDNKQTMQQYESGSKTYIEPKIYSFDSRRDEKYKKSMVFIPGSEQEMKASITPAETEADKSKENFEETYQSDPAKLYSEEFRNKPIDSDSPVRKSSNYEITEKSRLAENEKGSRVKTTEKTTAFNETQYSFNNFKYVFEDFKKDILAVTAKYEAVLQEEGLKAVHEATNELKRKIEEALAEKEKAEKELEAVKKELEQVKTELQTRKEAALQLKKILSNL
ncbi:AAA family ATPase [Thermoanaerobacter mathranii]|uniref:AAA family ATPase n=1 Tax=Thermoanaerobacter mathranii TaxID=583357 RepID=UPI003D6AC2D4